MKEHVELGKISKIRIGFGGYQGACFGVTFEFSGKSGWGSCDFEGTWGISIVPGKSHKWTEADRETAFAEVMKKLNKLCEEAKVSDVMDLQGKPIKAIFDSPFGKLVSWEILQEVL